MTEDQTVLANINVGILGHVDSGKTSLAKALSSTASTAAFDKSPESQRRGITLDLGFSACCISSAVVAPQLHAAGVEHIQCTFVDCPGHASLIRTILGGAQIIDIMILVIDACKGIQTQTAECIVIGEVLCKPLVVVINKIDAIQCSTPEEGRAALDKLRKRLQKTFERTRWPSVQMVEVAAAPHAKGSASGEEPHPINMEEVLSAVLGLVDVTALKEQLRTPLRSEEFVMMFDHCFALRGQGTVFTGTVLRGQVSVGDNILVPDSHVIKKVKGLQAFRKPLQQARRGDRVGLCVAQFDAEGVERGLLCSAQQQKGNTTASAPLLFESTTVMIAEVNRVRFHQLSCDAHTKFHITIGHSTVMGTMRYFSRPTVSASEERDTAFDIFQESLYVEELTEDAFLTFDSTEWRPQRGHPVAVKHGPLTYYAIILLERPIMAAVGTPLIATRLEMERDNMCRIAIAGSVRALLNTGISADASIMSWRHLPIVRFKSRPLVVERVINERTCIASGVVGFEVPDAGGGNTNQKSKEKDTLHAEVQKFIGMRVHFRPTVGEGNDASTATGVTDGVIDSAFGKTGKVKLVFNGPVFLENEPSATGRVKRGDVTFRRDGVVELTLKKYPLAAHSQLQQVPFPFAMRRLEVIWNSITHLGHDPDTPNSHPCRVSRSAVSELMDCMSYVVFPELSEPPMKSAPCPEQRLGGSAMLQWTLARMADIITSQIYSAFMLQGHTKCSEDGVETSQLLKDNRGSANDRVVSFGEAHPVGEAGPLHQEAKQRAEEITEAFLTRELRHVRWLIRTDAETILHNDVASTSLSEVVLCYPGILCMKHQRTAHALHQLGAPTNFTRLLTEMAHSMTGIDIHPRASIGHHFFIDHGTGIVIGSTSIIGNYVSIYHGVTLGTRSFSVDPKTGARVRNLARHPIIEDGVTIYANTMVLGRVRIGKDSIIGSSCRVLKDLPPKSVIWRTPNAEIPAV